MEKIKEMIASGDPEMVKLGMLTCQEKYPAVWAALLNFTRPHTKLTKEVVDEISSNSYCNIGSIVRYRGMEFAPTMVVTNIGVTTQSGHNNLITNVTAKYFNKGNQTFNTVADRIECFEIMTKNKDNES